MKANITTSQTTKVLFKNNLKKIAEQVKVVQDCQYKQGRTQNTDGMKALHSQNGQKRVKGEEKNGYCLRLSDYGVVRNNQGKEGFRGVVRVDACTLVTCDYDCLIKVWRETDCVQTLAGHSNIVRHIAYFPLRKLLVSTSNDNTARVYKRDEEGLFQLVKVITHQSRLWAIQVYENKGHLLLGGNQQIFIHSLETDFSLLRCILVNNQPPLEERLLVVFDIQVLSSQNGDELICSDKFQIMVFGIEEGEKRRQVLAHQHYIYHLQLLCPTLLVSVSEDQYVKLWNYPALSLACSRQLSMPVTSVAFLAEARVLLVGLSQNKGGAGMVQILSARSLEVIKTLLPNKVKVGVTGLAIIKSEQQEKENEQSEYVLSVVDWAYKIHSAKLRIQH